MQHPRPLDIIHEYRPAGWVGGGPRCARSAEVASRAWVRQSQLVAQEIHEQLPGAGDAGR
jgi:hypothetical protein